MSLVFAKWTPEYYTGNKKVDEEHQKLFEIVNKLHDAMKKGHGKDVLKQTLDELIKYTIQHFTDEEFFMLSKRYPRYKEHKKIHKDLTDKVKDLRAKFVSGDVNMNIELLHFLNQWLAHHIKGEDFKLFQYLKEQEKVSIENQKLDILDD